MANHTYCIELNEGDHDYLLSLSKNRTIQAQVCLRAKILLQKEAGKSDKCVADGLSIDVNTVRLCVDKLSKSCSAINYYLHLENLRRPHILHQGNLQTL